MTYYDSTGIKEITKATAVFVQDDDCHWYCIHEDDENLYRQVCDKAYSEDNFDEFEHLFPNVCGGSPSLIRNQLI